MLTRRQTLHGAGALGIAAPLLAACGGGSTPSIHAGDSGGLRLVSADVPQGPGDVEATGGAVSSMSAFARDLWRAVGKPDDNLALSPYSIAVALAMTVNGARGTTAAQMLEVMHVESLATYNAGMAALTQQLARLDGPVKLGDDTVDVALSTANQLFGDGAVRWQPSFLTVLAKQYGAGMRTVDFATAPETARGLINDWTAGQTHDRIPEIMPAGTVDPSTRLVLVDALYFKAPWAVPFEESMTKPGPFTRGDGSRADVPMMSLAEVPSSADGERYRGARLQYAGGALAMTLALPDPGDEEAALGELLDEGLVREGRPGLQLTMPRWTYRVATDLKDPLLTLGMSTAFGGGADFSGMTTAVDLQISEALHQTYVAVDEKGTEAAAATAVGMAESAIAQSAPPLVLDRPFLYVIHDTAHGTPLFVGRVTNPTPR
ncbi:MAG: serpin family protein [Nocardioides sp.]